MSNKSVKAWQYKFYDFELLHGTERTVPIVLSITDSIIIADTIVIPKESKLLNPARCFFAALFLTTVCSLGEVKKFLLISWAWKVRGSSGGWQTFNDTWTFDKYILHCTTNHFLNCFFIRLQFH